MGASTRLKQRQELACTEAAQFLSTVALELAHGEVSLEQDGQTVDLHPGPQVSVSVEGVEDRKRGELTIRLKWDTDLRIGAPHTH
jgi:amphi-Trp domain-containing protein